MSDQNTALPIRTEGDLQQKVQTKIVDYVDPSKGAEVDGDKNLHVELHGDDHNGVDKIVRLSESGNVVLDGEYDAVNNSKPSRVGLMAHLRNLTPGLEQLLQPLTAVTNGMKRLLDVALHDENGDAFSTSNPLPVTNVDSEGDEINHFTMTNALAANASADHEYTITAGKLMKLSKIMASASGKLKAEVKVETGATTGIFETKFVKFNSTANPNLDFNVKELISVEEGAKVIVTLTNREPTAQSVYSTISGHEIIED
jgi:hypothetical protein